MSSYSRPGPIIAGFDYQELHAADLLIEFLENPQRYRWVRVEADEAGYLDDIKAQRADGGFIYRQVKFVTNPEEESSSFSWDYLLDQEPGKRGSKQSLLQRWAESLADLRKFGSIQEAAVFTNRVPSSEISSALDQAGRIRLDVCPSEIRARIAGQLGSDDAAEVFFSVFEFRLRMPDPKVLEEGLRQRLLRLSGTNEGWLNLRAEIHDWVKFRDEPGGDGLIKLQAVRRAALWLQLAKLRQDFPLPDDYVLPSADFHTQLIKDVRRRSSGCIVVWGKPGVGKSTYLSYVTELLKQKGDPVIRHHYFMPLTVPTGDRCDHRVVAADLTSQLQRHLAQSLKENPVDPLILPKSLATCGEECAARGQVLTVVLDGLDHVYRDRNSIDELNRLFELLLPAPQGVVILVGTQRLADDLIPTALRYHAPLTTWRELPSFSTASVVEWLEKKQEVLDLPDHSDARRRTLGRLAEAFMSISSGLPLHLTFSLRALVQADRPITPETIETLPACSDGEIARYYEILWGALQEEGRQILNLLAATDFRWPRDGVVDCLGSDVSDLAAVRRGLQNVRHLLAEDEVGLSAFHSSLLVFIKPLDGYQESITRLRPRVVDWLTNKAPDYWRWAYLWREQEAAGEPVALRDGPNNEWAIEAIASCRPREIIGELLERSTQLSLNGGDLGRTVYLGILQSYVEGHLDYYDEVVDRLLDCGLRLEDDPYLARRLIADLPSLSASRMLVLSHRLFEQDGSSIAARCLDILRRRREEEEVTGGPHTFRPGNIDSEAEVELVAIRGGINLDEALSFFREFDRNRADRFSAEYAPIMVKTYSDGLSRRCDVENLKSIAKADLWAVEGLEVAAALTRLACEEAFAIDPHELCPAVAASAFLNVYRHFAKGIPLEDLPRLDLSALKPRRIDLFGNQPTVVRTFHTAFFHRFVHHLEGRRDSLCDDLNQDRWVNRFLMSLDSLAVRFAAVFSDRRQVRYGDVISGISDLQRPRGSEDRDGHSFASYATEALNEIAIDLLLLSRTMGFPGQIEPLDIDVSLDSQYWNLGRFVDQYLAYGRQFMTSEAVERIITAELDALPNEIEELPDRAIRYSRLAQLAAMNGPTMHPIAHDLLRKAAQCLIGHGHRKDILLFNALDSIEVGSCAGIANASSWIHRIAPMIGAVHRFTDGKGTRGLPGYLGRILLKVEPDRFGAYYKTLCQAERYRDAEDAMNAFADLADLREPTNAAIARTILNTDGLRALKLRADRGDEAAADVLSETKRFLGGLDLADEDGHLPTNEVSLEQTSKPEGPNPAAFPPDQLSSFLGIDSGSTFRYRGEAATRWLEYWRHHQPQAALEVIEALIREGTLEVFHSRLWDDLFEVKLEVAGKTQAWPLLIRAQRKNWGWTNYYNHDENVRRWAYVKRFYPERSVDFIKLTLMPEPGESSRSYSMHSSFANIVEFLVLMGRAKEAYEVIDASVSATIERAADLPLPTPGWVRREPHV